MRDEELFSALRDLVEAGKRVSTFIGEALGGSVGADTSSEGSTTFEYTVGVVRDDFVTLVGRPSEHLAATRANAEYLSGIADEGEVYVVFRRETSAWESFS